MPELPEVETIKNVIAPQIQGLKISEIIIKRPDIIAHPEADKFYALAKGRTIKIVSRRGKFMIITLDSESRIVLHLRMTGCLLLAPPELPEEKHTHIVFRFESKNRNSLNDSSSGGELRFSDTRRFGRFWALEKDEQDTYTGMAKLGPEPFDEKLTAEYLENNLKNRRKAVKECLLDQSIIAGIGNIYSDEILFTAGISPARTANSLEKKDFEKLAAVIPERLSYFIEKNKITPEEYLESRGQDYRNTPFLQVYGHAGEPCQICGSTLVRTVIGGRSSVYCPHCQKS